jgi:2-polyprenyl-3-methyl-5-hydroxy-6-metoxy-1,4-benzoquinol methylase
MNLLDVINRPSAPVPWQEGENIPWDDPDFSKRMLKEHLSQSHDAASRRSEKIDKHVEWIHRELLGGRRTRILDLACGPGLYTSRLARLGHECVGIDFSPASIEYARQQAANEKLRCTYVHDDIRGADYESEFDLIMLLYGEFNVFGPLDARAILRKVSQALSPDGILLLEPHTFAAVQRIGQSGRTWYSSKSGLFSEKPHFCLEERFWDESTHTATQRFYIADAAMRQVTSYAYTMQAYTTAEYESLLAHRGMEQVQFYPSLLGVKDPTQSDFVAIAAREGAEPSM